MRAARALPGEIMDTLQVIRQCLASFALAPLPDDDNASLFDLGIIDSFALMDCIVELEEKFGVKVPDAELVPKRFETVAKMAAYFEARKGA
jgi:acyl carrier protein